MGNATARWQSWRFVPLMSQPDRGHFSKKGKAVFKRALELIDTPKKFWPVVRRLYRWALDAGLDDCLAHYNYARILQHYGQCEEAETHYRRAIELHPKYHSAYNNLGNVLCLQGRYQEAEEAYRQALVIKEYVQPHTNLGDLYFRMGRLDEALKELEIALELSPRDDTALLNAALVLAGLGRKEEAEARFRQAVEAAPDDIENLETFAGFLEEEGREREAAELRARVERLEAEQHRSSPNLEEWERRSSEFYRTRRTRCR